MFLIILIIFIQSHLCFTQSEIDSNSISLHCDNKSLRSVLREISCKSKTNFIFCDALVDCKIITCNFKKVTMEQALHKMLSNSDIAFKVYPTGSVVLFNKISTAKIIEKKEIVKETIQSPLLKNKVKLCYPAEAKNEGLEGRVNMSLLVDENGDVKVSKVTRSSTSEILDKAAIEYAHKLKFDPAMKNGVPYVVWIFWCVNYKSPEIDFFQCDYIYKLNNLYKLADIYSGEKRNYILQNIILIHKDCIEYLKNKPEIDFNEIIKQVLLPEVYEEWKDLWKEWHLHFIVFQDFLLRYPDSELTSQVIADLLYYLEMDLADIKNNVNDNPYTQNKIYY